MEISPLLGVDRSTAFTDAELDVLWTDHQVKVIAFYLGGPYYSINGWNKSDVDRCIAKGFKVVPIYVGQNFVTGSLAPELTAAKGSSDALEAINLMHEFGFSDVSGLPIFLDMESATYGHNPNGSDEYAYAWLLTTKQSGAVDGLYCDLTMIDAMVSKHEPPGLFWYASWRYNSISGQAKLDDMPGVPNSLFVTHQRAWQYAGNVQLTGLAGKVDIDLFDSAHCISKDAPKSVTPTEVVSASTEIVQDATQAIARINVVIGELNSIANSLK